jgi:hypothetical protein
MRVRTHADAHTHTHTQMRVHTHIHTHTQSHAGVLEVVLPSPFEKGNVTLTYADSKLESDFEVRVEVGAATARVAHADITWTCVCLSMRAHPPTHPPTTVRAVGSPC